MPLPRRLHHHHTFRLHSFMPLICAISVSLLLLFALLSFLAPSPADSEAFHNLRRRSALFNVDANGDVHSAFRVPVRAAGEEQIVIFGVPHTPTSFTDVAMLARIFQVKVRSNYSANATTRADRFLVIVTSGGLNQQRTGIIDAVVAARILNATLVVPKLDQKSFWRDASDFSDVFDVDRFISFLSNDVKIVKQIPPKQGKAWHRGRMRVPRRCSERCYLTRVLPVFSKRHIIQLSKFDYRLSNRLGTDLQKLRCRVNYHALRFKDPIVKMGKELVHRMRLKNKHFVALHLRFEPDMLAFSGCDYGGGEKERKELGALRKRWKTLHERNPDKQRRQGRCPLTPEEVGLMLRSLGYGMDIHIYVASGEIYGGEETLQPLKKLFPNLHSKDTIASKEELEPYSAFSSQMAALDFVVCDESDVLVTNNNGNMAKMLAGRRKYFGHKPTIRPNSRKLYLLFSNRSSMTWEDFASKVCYYQRGFMGEPNEVRPGRGEFHENPSVCICEDSERNRSVMSDTRTGEDSKAEGTTRQEVSSLDQSDDYSDTDFDPDWVDPDDEGDQGNSSENNGDDGTMLEDEMATPDEPELDEVVTD